MSAKFHYTDERTPFSMMLVRLNYMKNLDVDKAHGMRVSLDYFHAQAKIVCEQRDSDKVLHDKWRAFELIQNGTGLFDECRQDAKLWPEVLRFLEYKDPFYTPRPEPSRTWPSEKPKRELNASEFFKILRDRVSKSEMPQRQKDFVNLGLLFLFAESHLPKEKRARLEERLYWFMIWQVLNKHQIMNEFRRSYELRKTVEMFFAEEKITKAPDVHAETIKYLEEKKRKEKEQKEKVIFSGKDVR